MLGIEGAAIGFALLLFLLFIGLHIASSLFLVSLLGAWLFFGDAMIRPFGTMMWGTLNNFLLVAIPLFVFMGEVLVRGGVTERMYRALSDWTRPLPGGLLHTNIAASTIFAAISGSSVATAATIGTVAFPTFRQHDYDEAWVAGSVASSAGPSATYLPATCSTGSAQCAPQTRRHFTPLPTSVTGSSRDRPRPDSSGLQPVLRLTIRSFTAA